MEYYLLDFTLVGFSIGELFFYFLLGNHVFLHDFLLGNHVFLHDFLLGNRVFLNYFMYFPTSRLVS